MTHFNQFLLSIFQTMKTFLTTKLTWDCNIKFKALNKFKMRKLFNKFHQFLTTLSNQTSYLSKTDFQIITETEMPFLFERWVCNKTISKISQMNLMNRRTNSPNNHLKSLLRRIKSITSGVPLRMKDRTRNLTMDWIRYLCFAMVEIKSL